jgi:hypothetical protein
MMAAVFATMSVALVLGRLGREWPAVMWLAACLVLSVWLFLFEIYSPEYGFRMPWIQTERGTVPSTGQSGGRA